jgi:hypothetical protein
MPELIDRVTAEAQAAMSRLYGMAARLTGSGTGRTALEGTGPAGSSDPHGPSDLAEPSVRAPLPTSVPRLPPRLDAPRESLGVIVKARSIRRRSKPWIVI